ncbi:MAG: GAF domain-containing protein [Spirochaetia bacterium]|nr:GAF domain-containing protein [Spirochaetia bacterium]
MINAPIPVHEDERLAALRRYEILDTESDEVFNELTRLASSILKAPMSLISIVDESRNWVKSGVGIDAGFEMKREMAFCAHAVAQDDMLVVPDLKEDQRFSDHPMTEPQGGGVRFYAGQQLRTAEGQNIGTLCVLDNKPRQFTPEERETLRILGRQVMSQLDLRRSLRELTLMNRKALALESILRRYTSRSIWERADVSASVGGVSLKDEVRDHACLFLDVVGFTRYAETHSAEEVVQILNDYFNPIVHKIHEAGGDVDKFVGDQVFAIFDRPEAAIQASLLARKCIDDLGAQRFAAGKTHLEFRIGLNYGPVVRGNVGGDSRSDNTLIGDVVNVAARLQSVCEPGRILASQSIASAAEGMARVEKRVLLKLKGKEEPVTALYLAPL